MQELGNRMRCSLAFHGEIGCQDDFLHDAITGALYESVKVDFSRTDAI
jgi:hypothetical protein